MLLISYILIIHLHIFHRLELFQIYRHLIFTNLNTSLLCDMKLISIKKKNKVDHFNFFKYLKHAKKCMYRKSTRPKKILKKNLNTEFLLGDKSINPRDKLVSTFIYKTYPYKHIYLFTIKKKREKKRERFRNPCRHERRSP